MPEKKPTLMKNLGDLVSGKVFDQVVPKKKIPVIKPKAGLKKKKGRRFWD